VRTVFEIFIQGFSTISAGLCRFILLPGEVWLKLMNVPFTAITHNKRLTLFDPEYRNKEQAEVVVHTLIIGLI
jgi:hypothetical protein